MRRKNILKEAGVLLIASLMVLSTIMITANKTIIKANTNVSENMYDEGCGCGLSSSPPPVGICDNFILPTEPTYPSTALLHWIVHVNPGEPVTRPCDWTGTDEFWATTFNLAGVCPQGYIKGATLTITVWNQDTFNDNDNLEVGCIVNNASNMDKSWNLTHSLSIPVGQKKTVVLDLTAYPKVFHDMINHSFLDVIVEDDSAVDCAFLNITCGCCFNVSIPKQFVFGVQVTIKNICNQTITNVSWSINVTGPYVWPKQTKTGTIASFPAASTKTIKDFVFGIGKITITVTVDNCPPFRYSALLFLFFVGNAQRIP